MAAVIDGTTAAATDIPESAPGAKRPIRRLGRHESEAEEVLEKAVLGVRWRRYFRASGMVDLCYQTLRWPKENPEITKALEVGSLAAL